MNMLDKRFGSFCPCERAGFTLLELTAAVFVLTVGLFGTYSLLNYGIDRIRTVNEAAIAIRSLQNELESLRAVPFAQLKIGEHEFISVTPEVERLVNAIAITRIQPATPDLLQVEVSLTWTGDQGRTMDKSLTTLIANKGV